SRAGTQNAGIQYAAPMYGAARYLFARVIAVMRSTVPSRLNIQTRGFAALDRAETAGIAANASTAANRSPKAAGVANPAGMPAYVAPGARNINPRCRSECNRRIGRRIVRGST